MNKDEILKEIWGEADHGQRRAAVESMASMLQEAVEQAVIEAEIEASEEYQEIARLYEMGDKEPVITVELKVSEAFAVASGAIGLAEKERMGGEIAEMLIGAGNALASAVVDKSKILGTYMLEFTNRYERKSQQEGWREA